MIHFQSSWKSIEKYIIISIINFEFIIYKLTLVFLNMTPFCSLLNYRKEAAAAVGNQHIFAFIHPNWNDSCKSKISYK